MKRYLVLTYGIDEQVGGPFCYAIGTADTIDECKKLVKDNIDIDWDGGVVYNENRWSGQDYQVDNDEDVVDNELEDSWYGQSCSYKWIDLEEVAGELSL